MRIREREIRDAGLNKSDVCEAQMFFAQRHLDFDRFYRGTRKAGWYVIGYRSTGTPGHAMRGKLYIPDLSKAVKEPEAIYRQWVAYAAESDADLSEDILAIGLETDVV